MDNAKDFIQTTLDLKIDHFNECNIDKDAFSKLKVKIKDEIIKVGFSASDCGINSNKYKNSMTHDDIKIALQDDKNFKDLFKKCEKEFKEAPIEFRAKWKKN